jgi:hypothetical protein
MPPPLPVRYPPGFLVSDASDRYQVNQAPARIRSLFRGGDVEHIDLSTEEEEIAIRPGDCSLPKSCSPSPPSTERVYIDLTIDNLEASTCFQSLFFRVSP